MLLVYRLAKVFLIFCLGGVAFADSKGSFFQFEFHTVPGMSRHLDLFAFPPFLALALENNAVRVSNSGRIQVQDNHTVKLERNSNRPFKSASLRFDRREGDNFFYDFTVDWTAMSLSTSLNFSVAVDTSQISNNLIFVRVYSKWAKAVPKGLVDYANLFIQKNAKPNIQSLLLNYLDVLDRSSPNKSLDAKREAILFQAYNATSSFSGGVYSEPGEAQSSGGILLLISFGLLMIVLPVGLIALLTIRYLRQTSLSSLAH